MNMLKSLISFLFPSYTKWKLLEVFYFANETYCVNVRQNKFSGLAKFKVVKVCQKEIDKTSVIKYFSEFS